MDRIYFVTLAKDTQSPFKPKSDEVGSEPAKPEQPKGKEEVKKTRAGRRQSGGGRAERPHRRPADSGRRITETSPRWADTLYTFARGAKILNRSCSCTIWTSGRKQTWGRSTVYEISADHKKMMVARDGGYASWICPKGRAPWSQGAVESLRHGSEAGPPPGMERKSLTNAGGKCAISSTTPTMHGVDWKAMRKKYRAAGGPRQSPRRPDLYHRRNDRRTEHRPHLCRRRRYATPAADS